MIARPVSPSAAPKRKLPLLTNSRLACYRRCPREHYLRYVLGRVPPGRSQALRFGDLIHKGLEAWWQPRYAVEIYNRLPDAIEAMRATCRAIPEADRPEGLPYDLARAEAMLLGYDARWGTEDHTVLGVEEEFRAPLRNPATGSPSRAWRLAGKLDVRVQDRKGRVLLIEHKSSSEDLSAGSAYWQRLRMDAQISFYLRGAEAAQLGDRPEGVIYDVLAKPATKPLRATPPEQRKYTQGKPCPYCKGSKMLAGSPCTACEGSGYRDPPHLYAGQRLADETPTEYRDRLVEAIAEAPERYYARCEVVRLDREVERHDREIWEWAKVMRKDEVHLHNPDACVRYGSVCGFFGLCSGERSMEELQQISWVHPELTEDGK